MCKEFTKVWINMETEEKEVCHHYTHRSTDSYCYCYVLAERSARLEQCGYDFGTSHIALEACASDTW